MNRPGILGETLNQAQPLPLRCNDQLHANMIATKRGIRHPRSGYTA
jgi:hypothetical protein